MADIEWTAPGPGSWQQDRAHLPVSATALIREMYPDGFARGFAATFTRWGVVFDDAGPAEPSHG